jgi:hypothetical protein
MTNFVPQHSSTKQTISRHNEDDDDDQSQKEPTHIRQQTGEG